MITKQEKKVGEKVRKYRKQKGLTQEELSEKVGITAKYIQYIETGRRTPSLKLITKLAKVLDTPLSELFK